MKYPGTAKRSKPSMPIQIKAALISGTCIVIAAIIGAIVAVILHFSSASTPSQQPSVSTAIVSPVPIYVTPSSSPSYARVLVAVISSSVSSSDQETGITLGFKNTGRWNCSVSIRTMYIVVNGQRDKPVGSTSPTLKIPVSDVSVQQDFKFPMTLAKGARYNLILYLHVGGCASPPDPSDKQYANYQLTVTG